MLRVLVVDDSEVSRRLLSFLLNSEEDIQVVGTAKDGEEALDMVARLKPDVVTMDVVMPRMDGFEATRRIMQTNPVPIVIVSASTSTDEVSKTFKALESGALAVVDKPGGGGGPENEAKVVDLVTNVRIMSEVSVVGKRYTPPNREVRRTLHPVRAGGGTLLAVGMGASTGGPKALEHILGALPKSFCLPLLVVQHIAAGFTRGLADWLDAATPLSVRIATNDEPLEPGRCYLSPSGFHMGVGLGGRIFLDTGGPGGRFAALHRLSVPLHGRGVRTQRGRRPAHGHGQ